MTVRLLIAALLLSIPCASIAQGPPRLAGGYPAKPIRIVVPFPAGGATDILARTVADRLAVRLSQAVVVDNKPGAGANIGAEAAAKSAPDGYTILMGSIASHSIAVSYYKTLGYDFRKDFAPVVMTGYVTNVVIVTPQLPVKSVGELIAYAKANPGKLTFASSGTGGLIHLTGEMFRVQAGIDIVHVPYKGTAFFLPDLFEGRVSMALDTLPPYVPHLKAGKVRALAVTTAKRSPALPDLPTVAEAGLPGFESVAIYGFLAPAGTPADIIALLNRETNAVLQEREVVARLAEQGIEAAGGTPEQLGAVMQSEIARWAKVIREAGIKPE